MGQRNGSAFCQHCAQQVLTIAQGPAHLVHGLIVTAGAVFYWPLALWIIPWALASVVRRPERCTKCGGDIAEMDRAAASAKSKAEKAARKAAKQAAKEAAKEAAKAARETVPPAGSA